MKTMTVVACRFKRGDNENTKWESGIAIGTSESGMYGGDDNNIETVIDSDGKAVPDPWDYKLEPAYGCFIRPLE